MTYRLFIMDRAYSSWSLRGHLLLDAFDLPFETTHAYWPSPEFDALRAEIAPGRTVPAMKTPEGALIWDSLAMAETLAERHPEAGLWPKDPGARAAARSLAAEMHSGFAALRSDCPMDLRRRYVGFQPSEAVLADIDRAHALWAWARAGWGGDGPYLFGAAYTAADAFYTPLAARFDTYDLPRDAADQAYIDALFAHPAFRRWRALAWATPRVNPKYDAHYAQGPVPREGAPRALSSGAPCNAQCPRTNRPIDPSALAEIDGHVVGFCDKAERDAALSALL